jgi:hypothetical protein
MRILAAILLSATLRATPVHGRGGDIGGGSNSFENQVVEHYMVTDPSTLKGYELFHKKLEALRDIAPEFADRVEAQQKNFDWYNVPVTLPPISRKKAGLPTASQQDCRQNGATHRILCDSRIRDHMSEESAAMQIMHEYVMSLLNDDKSSWKVTRLVGRIFADPPNAIAIGDALAGGEYGLYLSKKQRDAQAFFARRRYLSSTENLLRQANDACISGQSLEDIRTALVAGAEYGGIVSPFAVRENTFTWGTHYGDRDAYLARGGLNDACGPDGHQVMGKDQCREWDRFSAEKKPAKNLHERAMRASAVDDALSGVQFRAQQEMNDLVRQPAFQNILVIEAGDDKDLGRWSTPPPGASESLLKTYRTLGVHAATLTGQSDGERRALLCRSVDAARTEVLRRLDAMDAQKATGNFGPAHAAPAEPSPAVDGETSGGAGALKAE